jgi:hypothetical protein
MSDPALGLIAHPLAVEAHIFGESLCTSPRQDPLQVRVDVRMHGWPICELGREFDQRLGNEHSHGVEVARVRVETETLRFERDRAATAEGINNGR